MDQLVIEKLQKILSLAHGRGATEGEMQAALARAQEIAIKHGIDLASVPERQEKSRIRIDVGKSSEFRTSTRYEHPYHPWVALVCEACFDVKFLFWRTRVGSHPYIHKMIVIGEPTDVALALEIYRWLEDLFPSLYHKAVKRGEVLKNFAGQNGYYAGLYRGIKLNNEREKDKMAEGDKSKWALVVVSKKDAIEKHVEDNYKIKNPKTSRKSYDAASQRQGINDGKQIKLKQMGAGQDNTQIGS